MKNSVFFIVLIFGCFVRASELTTEQLLSYPSSFHAIMSSDQPHRLKDKWGEDCASEIRSILKSGGSFRSQIVDLNSQELSKSPSSEVTDLTFFHYTDSDAEIAGIKIKNVRGMFNYIRKNAPNRYFYVAADSESSKSYGKYQVTVLFSDNSKIFYPNGTKDKQPVGESVYTLVENELLGRYPSLDKCTKPDFIGIYDSLLVNLAAEASGVDLISYVGDDQWFMTLGEWAIKDLFYSGQF